MNQNNNLEINWTVGKILNWTTERFKQADIDTPLLDAQLLLCKVLNTTKINLYIDYEKPLSSVERTQLRELVKRRLAGEPVAYILNKKYWYDLEFIVNKHVLIPRPETECLLDFVIETANFYELSAQKEICIYDFCTGSGCLAIALAKKFPHATVVGVDISQDALAVAKENAQLNNVTNCEWVNLDLTQEESSLFLKNKYGVAEIIVANPPYVSEEEWKNLDISVKNYEPKLALTTQEEGLFIGKEIVKNCEKFSLQNEKNGIFAMEMGVDHPQKCINLSIKTFLFQSTVLEKATNEWFSLCDLDRKNRFLCKIFSTS